MAENSEIKRFTAKRKAELVMEIFQGKSTVSELARKYDLTPAMIEEWMEEARRGMENQLRARPKDIAALYEEKIKEIKAVIGELPWRIWPSCQAKRLRSNDSL